MIFGTGLENYYGEVEFKQEGNKYFMTLGCHSSAEQVEISEGFFNAALEEFHGLWDE